MELGKILVFVGIVFLLAGLMVTIGPKIHFLGNLPGDIKIERENFKFYFPLGTCILIGLILSLISWLISRK